MIRACVTALAGILAAPAQASEWAGRVYDGDTIGPTYRLTIDGELSFDTPEVSTREGAQCPLEIARGKAASARLRALLDGAAWVEEYPLLDGLGRVQRDRFGRGLTRLILPDPETGQPVNIGHILASEGHAIRYRWRSERIDWCATPPERKAR